MLVGVASAVHGPVGSVLAEFTGVSRRLTLYWLLDSGRVLTRNMLQIIHCCRRHVMKSNTWGIIPSAI